VTLPESASLSPTLAFLVCLASHALRQAFGSSPAIPFLERLLFHRIRTNLIGRSRPFGFDSGCGTGDAHQMASRFYDEWMSERRLLSVNVECYAGHRGEQTARTLILGDRRIAVAEVLDAWLAPEYRYARSRS
jgi:hypothetical protein